MLSGPNRGNAASLYFLISYRYAAGTSWGQEEHARTQGHEHLRRSAALHANFNFDDYQFPWFVWRLVWKHSWPPSWSREPAQVGACCDFESRGATSVSAGCSFDMNHASLQSESSRCCGRFGGVIARDATGASATWILGCCRALIRPWHRPVKRC